MKRVGALLVVAALCVASAAMAQESRKRPPNPGSQGSEAIQSLKATIRWDSSTRLKGGQPKEGQTVELSAVNRDGNLVATTIQVVSRAHREGRSAS